MTDTKDKTMKPSASSSQDAKHLRTLDEILKILITLAIFCLVVVISISIIESVREEAATCGYHNYTLLAKKALEAGK